MKKNYTTIVINSVLISAIGVFIIDYFSHLLFSNPMETVGYFFAKSAWYLVFSGLVLSVLNLQKNELMKVVIAGITAALLWGTYYNILPEIFDYYPFGIPLNGLSFWGMGLLGTGIAFGTVHTLAFIAGYYASRFILKILSIHSLTS